MKEYVIFKIVLFMLKTYAGVSTEDLSYKSKCHLLEVAYHAHNLGSNEHEQRIILAIGYIESKFNHKGDEEIKSTHGACGIYQQIPKYAKPLNCNNLQNTQTATEQVLKVVRDIFQNNSSKLSKICKYNSGPKCNPGSEKYAKNVIKIYEAIGKMNNGTHKKFNNFETIDEEWHKELKKMCKTKH